MEEEEVKIAELEETIKLHEKYEVEMDCWDEGIEQCRSKEIEILAENMSESEEYISTQISDKNFYWLSEVFVEIVEKTQSVNFYNTVKERLKTVANEEYKRSISVEIECIEGILGDALSQPELPFK